MPPGVPRSRSFTRFTMRVGLPHFGQSVLFVVSIIFLRSAVFAIFAMSLLQFKRQLPICAFHRVDLSLAVRGRGINYEVNSF
jgi:hypothetical protein